MNLNEETLLAQKKIALDFVKQFFGNLSPDLAAEYLGERDGNRFFGKKGLEFEPTELNYEGPAFAIRLGESAEKNCSRIELIESTNYYILVVSSYFEHSNISAFIFEFAKHDEEFLKVIDEALLKQLRNFEK